MSNYNLFKHFSPYFFVPFSSNTARHSERVAKKLFENYSENGLFFYKKDELKEIIINEKKEDENNYTVDGLLEAMEKGEWLDIELSSDLKKEYIINDKLFDFYEAIDNIKITEKDIDSMNDIRVVLSNLIEEHNIDSISTMNLMIKENQRKMNKINKKIKKKMKDIKEKPSTIESLLECKNPDFKEIFQKDISAVFSLKTDISPIVGKIDRILSVFDDEYEHVIENITKKAENRDFDGMSASEYVREELNKIRDSLSVYESFRMRFDDSIFAISMEMIKRLNTLMSFRNMNTNLDYDLIFDNLDKYENNTGKNDIITPFIRAKTVDINEPTKMPFIKKEKIKGEKINKINSSEFEKSDYDKATNINRDIVMKIIKKENYKKLSDIPIDNIYNIMLFITAEKFCCENNNESLGVVQTKFFRFEDRVL